MAGMTRRERRALKLLQEFVTEVKKASYNPSLEHLGPLVIDAEKFIAAAYAEKALVIASAESEVDQTPAEFQVFEIWSEGNRYAKATLLGYARGLSFREACVGLANQRPDMGQFINFETLTYNGCRLFDNERRARRNFG